MGLQPPEQRPHTHPPVLPCSPGPGPGPRPSLTLRTDTRKMQGSSRPVAGLALILHTKVNRLRHRTQFSCTSSLQARWEVSAQGTNEGQGSAPGRQWWGGGWRGEEGEH